MKYIKFCILFHEFHFTHELGLKHGYAFLVAHFFGILYLVFNGYIIHSVSSRLKIAVKFYTNHTKYENSPIFICNRICGILICTVWEDIFICCNLCVCKHC